MRRVPDAGEDQARLEALEAEMGDLRRELGEAQERLDFAERVLAQGPDARRVGPER
jgi:chromosome segregation ATPase